MTMVNFAGQPAIRGRMSASFRRSRPDPVTRRRLRACRQLSGQIRTTVSDQGETSRCVDTPSALGNITHMALSQKRATTIALDPELDKLLTRVARAHRISRSEFVRQQLDLALEQYRRHPLPKVAGMIRRLPERGDESELFRGRR